jgi:flagellar hook protein FlgE
MQINFQQPMVGMANARNQMLRSSSEISRWGSTEDSGLEPVQLEKEIVNMITAESNFDANAAVFKVQDEMVGTLLDILA